MAQRVLIVDDESEVSRFLLLRLERQGYRVRVAVDGEKALEIARDEKPDLILLDISLPQINGYEVARLVRQEPFLQDTKIIFQTADSEVEIKSKQLGLFVDGFMVKPFTSTELYQKIEECLNSATA